jgi:murein tripeptide amidase MpaA
MRRTTLTAGAIALCAATASAQYQGDKVVRAIIQTPAQLQAVETLSPDYWTHGVGIGPVEMRLSPAQLRTLEFLGVRYDVMIDDVQALVDAERNRLNQPRELGNWYDDYKTLAEHTQRWQDLELAHPNLVTLDTFGQSLEGRDLVGIRITTGGGGTRPIILINGGQHAREWVSPMVVTGLAEYLATEHAAGNPRIVNLLSKVDFWIAPILNPDGYEFTWASERLWRKNRRDNGGGCFGVDLNRNWEVGWSAPFGGSSTNPCSDTYRGPAEFSEPETTAFRDWTIGQAQRIAVHIDTHSYSQLILSPWGYQTTPPPEIELFDQLGAVQADAIHSVHGEEYVFGQSSTTLYIASGTAKDFGYVSLDSLAWTIELRPENASQGGFILDPMEIIPNRDEYIEGILALTEAVTVPMLVQFAPVAPRIGSGEELDVQVQITERLSTYAPGTATLHYRTGPGAFTELPMAGLGALVFEASIPGQDCEDVIELFVTADAASGETVRAPQTGELLVNVRDAIATTFDDCETNTGWVVGAPGDTATTGIWNRMDPEGTQAQPEDDHTPAPGTDCWVTDGVAGQGLGSRDVDGGATTLTSPAFDATEPWDIIGEAYVTYHRWYSNDQGSSPNQDSMPISISNDGGQTWVLLEDVDENAGAWVRSQFRIADFVAPGPDIRLRFVARDEGQGSIVEAGVDDVDITFIGCARHPADFNKDGMLDVFDFLAFQDLFVAQDPRADLDQSTGVGVFDIFDFLEFQDLFVGG